MRDIQGNQKGVIEGKYKGNVTDKSKRGMRQYKGNIHKENIKEISVKYEINRNHIIVLPQCFLF